MQAKSAANQKTKNQNRKCEKPIENKVTEKGVAKPTNC